jgi:glycosyltransferase involved in cell wall biosynthesis
MAAVVPVASPWNFSNNRGIGNMQNPRVTIIVPTYNGEKYIAETLDSCISQSYENTETIVIDDASTDDTYNIISNYSRLHPNVIVLRNDKNQGLMANLNKATSQASGDYLIFLGHDDLLPVEHVAAMLKEFNDETVFVHCNSITIDSAGATVSVAKDDEEQSRKNEDILFELSLSNFIHSCGCVIRKSSFLQIGGAEEKYKNYGEWLYWIKLASIGKVKFSTVSRSFRRKHESNLTKTFTKKPVREELFRYKCDCRMLAYTIGKFNGIKKLRFWWNYVSALLKHKSK